MELTREEIERLANYDSATDGDTQYMDEFVAQIAKQLLAEMDAPKVWTNAPDNAIIAQVHFYKAAKTYATPSGTPEVYTRDLPKSRIDEIAEEAANEITHDKYSIQQLSKTIKSAILKDRETREV